MTSEQGGAVLAELRAALPPGAVLTDPTSLRARSVDASGARAGEALAVVLPESTAQVAQVAQIAHRHRVPIVPQGALSGLAGGANAVDGAILLALTRMDSILSIDPVDQVAVVQAGVITETLARAVAAQGLFYPPDPASAAQCTIGGNIATNAGGMRCVKYGATRDVVRCLGVVLADGRVVRTGPPTLKGVAGLDLTGVIVGSEGTLAIITEATLGLLAAPGRLRGVSATFATAGDALEAANAIMAGQHPPSTLEYLDGIVLAAIAAHDPHTNLPIGAQAMLLVLTDARAGGDQDVAAYERAAREHGALRVDVATAPADLDGLLAARRAFNPAMRALRGGSLNEDVVVPRTRLAELLSRLAELSVEVRLPIGTGGHVGDGNLHPVIAFDPADPAQRMAADRAHTRVLDLAVELGGSVTGEHGIGVEKRAALDAELGPSIRELQRAIKASFDPTGILNPGKKL